MKVIYLLFLMCFLVMRSHVAIGQTSDSKFDAMAQNRLAVFSLKALADDLGAYNSKGEAWRFGITDGDWLAGFITIIFPEGIEGKQCLIRVSNLREESKDPFYSPVATRDVVAFGDVSKWIKDTDKSASSHIGSPIADGSRGPKLLFFFERVDGEKHSMTRYVWFDEVAELSAGPREMTIWTYIHALKYAPTAFKDGKFSVSNLPIK